MNAICINSHTHSIAGCLAAIETYTDLDGTSATAQTECDRCGEATFTPVPASAAVELATVLARFRAAATIEAALHARRN